MPKSGKHAEKVLSALAVKTLQTPGRYHDGNGLYLVVAPSGAKQWVSRLVIQGKRRDMGLGGLSTVTLAEARELALEARKSARGGGNPIVERAAKRRVVPTFQAAAEAVHEERKAGWKNDKHQNQWLNTLKDYAYPFIKDKPVNVIETSDILSVLKPIWTTKKETASRVRQRLGKVFDWAKAKGYREGDNPVASVELGLGDQKLNVKHHKALDYTEISNFYKQIDLCGSDITTKIAFKILILTACRTGEVLKAEWKEFDLSNAIWTIPANRMKMEREHRVPLCEEAVNLIEFLKPFSGHQKHIFLNLRTEKVLSNMVFLTLLKRMEKDITAHGFRSTFRDWAGEETHTPNEVCEMALAHSIKDKTEKAYRRGDLFEKRKSLMTEWGKFILNNNCE